MPRSFGSQQCFSALVFDAHEQLASYCHHTTWKGGTLGSKRLSPVTWSRRCPFLVLVHMYDCTLYISVCMITICCLLNLKNKIQCFCICLPCLDALVCKVIDHLGSIQSACKNDTNSILRQSPSQYVCLPHSRTSYRG